MAFPIKNWQNRPQEITPIDAAGLKDLERRLSDYTDKELLALRAALEATIVTKQDAVTAATDAELTVLREALEAVDATLNAAVTEARSRIDTIEAGQAWTGLLEGVLTRSGAGVVWGPLEAPSAPSYLGIDADGDIYYDSSGTATGVAFAFQDEGGDISIVPSGGA